MHCDHPRSEPRTQRGPCMPALGAAVRVFKAESRAAARIYEDPHQLAEGPFKGQ